MSERSEWIRLHLLESLGTPIDIRSGAIVSLTQTVRGEPHALVLTSSGLAYEVTETVDEVRALLGIKP